MNAGGGTAGTADAYPARAKAAKRSLSFTQINMYLRCPRQYRYRYTEGHRTPSSGAAIQGRVWHDTLERNYRQKVTSHQDLPLEELQEFFAERFDEALKIEEIALERGEDLDALKDQGLAIVAAHHLSIAPRVQPLFVEKSFRVPLGADFPYELTGVWDLVEQDCTIADGKAYSKTPSQADLDRDLQLGLYSLAYRLSFNEIEKGLRVDAVIKTKEPKAVQLSTSRTNRDCRWVLGLIEDAARGIDREVFFPNPTGWWCGPKYCGFWDRCMDSNNIPKEDKP